MRASGVLLPISSLPSKYGIGAFSREAYEFVDKLSEAGQKYWQILPLGPTGYGESPYQSFSTFAGNPYFIDLEALIREGLLSRDACDACDFGDDDVLVDYGKLYKARYRLLWQAFEQYETAASCTGDGCTDAADSSRFDGFRQENQSWLADYALYMAVKDDFGGQCWSDWPRDIRNREPEAMAVCKKRLKHRITFYEWLQYEFDCQWRNLKAYANDRGIRIIGDLPIYGAFDSADTWANPELFQFDGQNVPVAVAGCPPDGFAADGQLWGNPLYRWDYHRETDFSWWTWRIRYSLKLYDVVRIDHFRGFDEYYSIPFGETTARNGHWEKGPGIEFFNILKKEIPNLPVIAEDLGYLTPSVIQLVKDTGFPGMKIIEFAFDSREAGNYLPYTYDKNCVVYTGTHDNQTIRGWIDEMNVKDRALAYGYLNLYDRKTEVLYKDFIRLALSSVADTAIIPMQDYLGLGAEARLNTPSTLGNNWRWRLKPGQFTQNLVIEMHSLAKVYGRL